MKPFLSPAPSHSLNSLQVLCCKSGQLLLPTYFKRNSSHSWISKLVLNGSTASRFHWMIGCHTALWNISFNAVCMESNGKYNKLTLCRNVLKVLDNGQVEEFFNCRFQITELSNTNKLKYDASVCFMLHLNPPQISSMKKGHEHQPYSFQWCHWIIPTTSVALLIFFFFKVLSYNTSYNTN